MTEPVEASSLYSGAPLFSFSFGVQFNVGDFLGPVCAYDFPEISSLESVLSICCECPRFAIIEEYICNIMH